MSIKRNIHLKKMFMKVTLHMWSSKVMNDLRYNLKVSYNFGFRNAVGKSLTADLFGKSTILCSSVCCRSFFQNSNN